MINDLKQLIVDNLPNCALPQHEKDFINSRINIFEEEELEIIWNQVQLSELDPISSGRNYNQTDIKTKIQREL